MNSLGMHMCTQEVAWMSVFILQQHKLCPCHNRGGRSWFPCFQNAAWLNQRSRQTAETLSFRPSKEIGIPGLPAFLADSQNNAGQSPMIRLPSWLDFELFVWPGSLAFIYFSFLIFLFLALQVHFRKLFFTPPTGCSWYGWDLCQWWNFVSAQPMQVTFELADHFLLQAT